MFTSTITGRPVRRDRPLGMCTLGADGGGHEDEGTGLVGRTGDAIGYERAAALKPRRPSHGMEIGDRILRAVGSGEL